MYFLFGGFYAELTSQRQKKRRPEIGDVARTICKTLFFCLRGTLPYVEGFLLWIFGRKCFFSFLHSNPLQITSQNKQEVIRWEESQWSRRADVMFRSDAFDVTFWYNFACVCVFENEGALRTLYKVVTSYVIG